MTGRRNGAGGYQIRITEPEQIMICSGFYDENIRKMYCLKFLLK